MDTLVTAVLPGDEFDILGLIYQSFLQEGKKNIIGSYYTPQKIVCNMIKDFDFSDGKLFFDPCCGSGAFLLSVAANNPNQIFGVDNDKVAVLISKINLLLKYKDFDFKPQVYCFDFLMGYSIIQQHPVFKRKFDYIATNPPWGAMDDTCSSIDVILSKETFSYFFVKAYEQLKDDGMIKFLFPEAILNVKIHKDIRKFILDIVGLVSITIYDDMFSGVTTKYVDMACGLGADREKFIVYTSGKKRTVDIRTVYETENLIFNLLSDDDMSIIRAVKDRGSYSLQNSVWALGIVTGDNKKSCLQNALQGWRRYIPEKKFNHMF
ncbi:MAG: N-6 DNA methylase [Lachnospiraceae bacterium]|nr:N-6 DNA methylase [Lachnospiraceae bacterium]